MMSAKKNYEDVVFKISGQRQTSSKEDVKSFTQLSWYVGVQFRREAEALLKDQGIHGMYLLRKSPRHDGYAVSVRYNELIKHFYLEYDQYDQNFHLGPEIFATIGEFVGFVESQPTINHMTDDAVCLKFPYVRPYESQVEETVDDYETATDYNDGFLLKRGAIHKNWKYRWFVVNGDIMKYYNSRGDERPLREVDISKATEVSLSEVDDKENCFCLVTPARTFYFVAQSSNERDSWLMFFKSRIRTDGLTTTETNEWHLKEENFL